MIVRAMLPFLATRAKVVYCPHGWAFERSARPLSGLIARVVERALTSITDAIVCVSESELRAGCAAGIRRERISLVRSGIRPVRPKAIDRHSRNWATPKLRVLFVGRFDRQKGVDILLEAAASLQDRVDVRLVGSNVVGKGGGLKLPANVTMLGWMNRNEIEAQYDAAQVVVISSRWEAFGLVALEAMRAGKPIVASRVGALPEIVIDGVTGLLCEPANSVVLAAALEQIAGADLADLGRRGYQRFCSLFTIDRAHRDLCAVYAGIKTHTAERAITDRSTASPFTK
jgi:glycosyltransferase involved in cell wall biosynthesis